MPEKPKTCFLKELRLHLHISAQPKWAWPIKRVTEPLLRLGLTNETAVNKVVQKCSSEKHLIGVCVCVCCFFFIGGVSFKERASDKKILSPWYNSQMYTFTVDGL